MDTSSTLTVLIRRTLPVQTSIFLLMLRDITLQRTFLFLLRGWLRRGRDWQAWTGSRRSRMLKRPTYVPRTFWINLEWLWCNGVMTQTCQLAYFVIIIILVLFVAGEKDEEWGILEKGETFSWLKWSSTVLQNNNYNIKKQAQKGSDETPISSPFWNV